MHHNQSLNGFIQQRHRKVGSLSIEELAARRASTANLKIQPSDLHRPNGQFQNSAILPHSHQSPSASAYPAYDAQGNPNNRAYEPNGVPAQQESEPQNGLWDASSIGEDSDTTVTDIVRSREDKYIAQQGGQDVEEEGEFEDGEYEPEGGLAHDEDYSRVIDVPLEAEDLELERAKAALDQWVDTGSYKLEQSSGEQIQKRLHNGALGKAWGISGRFEGVNLPIHSKQSKAELAEHHSGHGQLKYNGSSQQNAGNGMHVLVRPQDHSHVEEALNGGDHISTGHSFSSREIKQSSSQAIDAFPPSDVGDDTGSIRSESPSRTTPVNGRRIFGKRPVVDLDYDEETLRKMTYEQLSSQPFDNDPTRLDHTPLSPVYDSKLPLTDRLQQIVDQPEEHELQGEFFSVMSLDQWEECGDWFLEQFGEIISQLRTVRRKRREISGRFEDELTAREEAIQAKSDGVKDVLQKMKAGGQGVLRGK